MPDDRHNLFGPTSKRLYDELIKRCKEHIQSLTTVQFDPETGIRRHFFNGKIERTIQVRGIKRDH